MPSNSMPKQRAIQMHLSDQPPVANIKITSGFAKCVKDARSATGRVPETGEKVPGAGHGRWLGAIGYMALLDQIGTSFRPSATDVVEGNSIRKALQYFSALSCDEIDALYAMRCAFAHDFSLYNINVDRPRLTHCFRLEPGPAQPVVTLPATRWDGDFSTRSTDNTTIIRLEAFGDLVESICSQLFELANAGELEVELDGGSDELLSRYGIMERLVAQ